MPVLSIVGTKGGVGKSTIAMGTAIWLSKLQDELVLLVDGDIHVRTIELKMCPKTDITLAQVLEGKHELVDAIYRCQLTAKDKWLYPKLSILPAGKRFMPLGGRDIFKYLTTTINRFEKRMETLREYFPYIIVDTPPSVTFEHFILTSIADGLIFVTTPDVVSIFSSKETAAGLKEMLGIDTVGTILNKVPLYFTQAEEENWENYSATIAPLLGKIYKEDLVEFAFKRNLPVVTAYPNSMASNSLKKIAKRVAKLQLPRTRVSSKFKRALALALAKKKIRRR
ncbi:MAG: MinD/ParA family protein [Candidatus Hadarchaeales archaeon]